MHLCCPAVNKIIFEEAEKMRAGTQLIKGVGHTRGEPCINHAEYKIRLTVV